VITDILKNSGSLRTLLSSSTLKMRAQRSSRHCRTLA